MTTLLRATLTGQWKFFEMLFNQAFPPTQPDVDGLGVPLGSAHDGMDACHQLVFVEWLMAHPRINL